MKRIALVSALVLLFVLAGCSRPQPVFEQYIAAVQKGDFTTASTLRVANPEGGVGPTFDKGQEAMQTAWFAKVKVENVKTVTNGDTATVVYKITAPDLGLVTNKVLGDMAGTIMGFAFANAFSNDQAQSDADMKTVQNMAVAKILAELQKPEVIMASRDGTATLVKVDGTWKISKLDVAWDFAL